MMILRTPNEMAVDAAERFRSMRKAKKITIKELSRRSGVPYSTVRRFESTGEVSFVALVKMTSAMDEDRQIADLFSNRVPSSIEEVIRANTGQA